MQTWLPSELVESLGWTLLHFVWQGLAIALLLAICLRMLRNGSANHRYLASCAALLCVVVAPVITFCHFIPPKSAPLVSPTTEIVIPLEAPVVELAQSSPVSIPKIVVAPKPAIAETGLSQKLKAFLPQLVLLWFAGVFVLSARLLFGCWRVNRLKRAAGICLAGPWPERLADLARKLEINRPLRAIQSALVEVPTVIGWLRPVILLPATCLAGLNPIQLEAILVHELAHIRRHDYLINLLQNIVETLLFYHPLVWWISRRIREERENCCDDLAVKICGDPVVYARALATLEELRPAPAQLSLAASGAPLLQRIKRLLGRTESPSRPAWPLAGVLILLLLVGAASCVRGYRSTMANTKTEPSLAANASAPSTNSMPTPTNAVVQTNQESVATLVKDGKFYFEAGRLDDAEDKLTRAMQLDPTSVAAHFYLRLVREKRTNDAAGRSELESAEAVLQVERSWDVKQRNGQLIPRPTNFNRTNLVYTSKGRQNIISKLDRIRVPAAEFDNVPLAEVIRKISEFAITNDPGHEGIPFMIDRQVTALDLANANGANKTMGPVTNALDATKAKIKLVPQVVDIRLGDLLDAIVKAAEQPIKYSILDYAVLFSLGAPDPFPLEIRTFRVDTNLLRYIAGSGAAFPQGNALTQSGGGTAGPVTVPRTNISGGTSSGAAGGIRFVASGTNSLDEMSALVRRFFDVVGIDFNTNRQSGKTFIYNDRKGVLTLRATTQDMELLTAVLNAYGAEFDGSQAGIFLPPLSPANLRQYQKMAAEWEANSAKKKQKLDELKGLSSAALRQAMPAATSDAILITLFKDLESAQSHLITLQNDYGLDHPEVKRARALVADLDKHIDQRIEALMMGLETEVQTSKNLAHDLEAMTNKIQPKVAAKLERIHISAVQFANTPLPEVVKRLSELAVGGDPDNKGINFVIERKPDPPFTGIDPHKGVSPFQPPLDDDAAPARVSVSWQGGSLADFLDAIVAAADRPLKYSVHDYGVVFSPKQPEPPLLAIRTFRVDPETFRQQLEHIAGPIPSGGPDSALRRFFAELGITLDTNSQFGRTCVYGDRRGILTVRATADELDKIGQALAPLAPPPVKLRFKVRMAEVTQSEIKGGSFFGFVTPFKFLTNAGDTFSITEFITGGTNAVFSNLPPVMTILSTNSGQIPLVGVLSPENFRVMLQQLTTRDGVDLLTLPEVVLPNNHRARVVVGSTQPVVVESTNSLATISLSIGTVVDLHARISSDGKTIQLTAKPTITEFLGYDKPASIRRDHHGKIPEAGPIPHFRLRELTVNASVQDGETLECSGLSTETELTMTSKVPVLGDLPVVSPLFRSKSSRTVKKNLMVFITPTILHPGDPDFDK